MSMNGAVVFSTCRHASPAASSIPADDTSLPKLNFAFFCLSVSCTTRNVFPASRDDGCGRRSAWLTTATANREAVASTAAAPRCRWPPVSGDRSPGLILNPLAPSVLDVLSRVSELPNLTDGEDLATMSQPFRAPGPRQRLEIKRMLKSAEELAAAEGGGLSADQVLDKTRLYWTHAENNLKGSKEQLVKQCIACLDENRFN